MLLGFNEAFIPAIVAGTKIHTIRAGARWQVGDTAQFCARAQQPDQYEFWAPRPIVRVQAIELTANELRVDGRLLPPLQLLALAQADGFGSAAELLAFFTDKPLPFQGQLVHWTDCQY